MRKAFKLAAVTLLFVLLSACSSNIEEEKSVAKKAVTNVFASEQIVKTNKNINEIDLYLPRGAKLNDSVENNVVFKKGKHRYILFINPYEKSKSEVVYQSTVNPDVDYVMNETFTSEEDFGYMLAHQVDGKTDVYELTVGIGGIKITTETNTKKLSENAELMMEIVKSVEKDNV